MGYAMLSALIVVSIDRSGHISRDWRRHCYGNNHFYQRTDFRRRFVETPTPTSSRKYQLYGLAVGNDFTSIQLNLISLADSTSDTIPTQKIPSKYDSCNPGYSHLICKHGHPGRRWPAHVRVQALVYCVFKETL